MARRYGSRALALVFAVVLAASLYESITVTGRNPSLAYFAIHTRGWELATGALIAILAVRLRALPPRLAEVLAWLGIATILLAGFAYSDATPFPGTAALLPVAGAGLVIAAGCAGPFRRFEAVLGRRPVQGLGKISYGWYLWHWPVLMLMLMPMIWHETFTWERNLEVSGLALWLALLTYFAVENPAKVSRLRRPAWLGIGVLGSASAAGVALLVAASLPALAGSGKNLHVATAEKAADPAYLRQVGNEIQGSTLIHAVPANLTPDLADAAHDYPETSFTQGCHANFLNIKQGPCVFGDPHGTRTVVLFGDSHMEQWEPAFAEAAKREHWRVVSWTKSACPLIDKSIRNDQLNRTYTECMTWRHITIGRIIDLHPDLVIAGQSDFVTGKAFTDQVYADSTVATLDRFKKAGLKVHYMLDIEYPAVDVPVCISAHLTDATACGRSTAPDWTTPRRHTLQTDLAEHG